MLTTLFKTSFILLSLVSILFARDIDINSLTSTADKSNKTLFIFLHMTGCGYCDSMKEFTLDDDDIIEFLDKKFLFEHINVSEKDNISYKNFKGSGKEFANFIGYDFYPSSLFFDEKSNLIFALPGYQDEKRFSNILKYVDSASYKTEKFHSFEKRFKSGK